MSVTLAALDALRDFLPLPTGSRVDDSAALPAKYLPATLYVWPDVALPQKLEEANGRWPEADLRLRVLYGVAAKGEARVNARDRDVSATLAQWVDDAHAAIEAHRRHPLWWDAYIDNVKYDAVRSIDVRGVGLVVVLRLIPGAEASSSS